MRQNNLPKFLLHTFTQYILGLASWRVAFEPHKRGLRKLRPRVELQHPQGCKAKALAPEQKRNVHPASVNDAC